MPRSINELSPEDKCDVALSIISLEFAGIASASKQIADKFDIDRLAVASIKKQALKAIKEAFEKKEVIAEENQIDINAGLARLKSASSNKASSNEVGRSVDLTPELTVKLDNIWQNLQSYNSEQEKRKEIKLQASRYVLEQACKSNEDLNDDLIATWLETKRTEIDSYNKKTEEYNKKPGISKGSGKPNVKPFIEFMSAESSGKSK